MAVKIIANSSKRLGLPGYSSHPFSVSVETELRHTGGLQNEAAALYHILQSASVNGFDFSFRSDTLFWVTILQRGHALKVG